MKKIVLLLFFIITEFCFSQSDEKGSFKTEVIIKKQVGYALHIPKNNKEKKPLILFIAGDGEKGTAIEKVKINGPFNYLKNNELDAYILAPQCLENEEWDVNIIYQLIVKIQKENTIDANRIYVTGLSSGAWATFNLAIAYPELFAAVVPISGYVDLYEMDYICKIKTIPTQIFHGLLDDVVNVDYAISVYKLLKGCNANVKLTIFDDAGHDSWTRVYDNPEIYNWMFLQVKK
ncbi:prolyl oligopeptidase family serine peptidase [Flavobacterium myungsuense]|uniref:Prolyl oligopeptidase family serine peptidase n=1 Tax=Flavobacterium myungsuense TaxID=651823 RepID=A0ABW3J4E2_9FLAO